MKNLIKHIRNKTEPFKNCVTLIFYYYATPADSLKTSPHEKDQEKINAGKFE